jgi:hypothetical protein
LLPDDDPAAARRTPRRCNDAAGGDCGDCRHPGGEKRHFSDHGKPPTLLDHVDDRLAPMTA